MPAQRLACPLRVREQAKTRVYRPPARAQTRPGPVSTERRSVECQARAFALGMPEKSGRGPARSPSRAPAARSLHGQVFDRSRRRRLLVTWGGMSGSTSAKFLLDILLVWNIERIPGAHPGTAPLGFRNQTGTASARWRQLPASRGRIRVGQPRSALRPGARRLRVCSAIRSVVPSCSGGQAGCGFCSARVRLPVNCCEPSGDPVRVVIASRKPKATVRSVMTRRANGERSSCDMSVPTRTSTRTPRSKRPRWHGGGRPPRDGRLPVHLSRDIKGYEKEIRRKWGAEIVPKDGEPLPSDSGD